MGPRPVVVLHADGCLLFNRRDGRDPLEALPKAVDGLERLLVPALSHPQAHDSGQRNHNDDQ
jgi:hypothetical protein